MGTNYRKIQSNKAQLPLIFLCRWPETVMMRAKIGVSPDFFLLSHAGSADFPGGRGRCQEYSAASLNMKNLMSPAPRN